MLDPELSAARQRLERAYAPADYARAGALTVELLAEHYAKVHAREAPVLPWRDPAELHARAARRLAEAPQTPLAGSPSWERFASLVREALSQGTNLHHPRCMGHQVPPPLPWAAWFDVVGSLTNQVMAVCEMGPWSTAAETALVDELGGRIGWPAGSFSGLLTSGGSVANLTALLTARNVACPAFWDEGAPPNGAPLILAQADAHYAIVRAAGVLGLGARRVRKVPLDARRRMDPQALARMLAEAAAQHETVAAVAACAGATPTGAFDPLEEIADVCKRFGVWLHVDAAHGGAALFSRRRRGLLAGVEQADSLVWDAHKMLYVPALAAFVLYKNREHRFEAFRQDAPYLFDPSAPGLAEFDLGLKTLECTKRAASFGLWGLWCLWGPTLFEDLVDCAFDLAHGLWELLRSTDDFLPMHEPQANILVFRHIPRALVGASEEKVGAFQLALRRRVIDSEEFYLVQTKLNGVACLRVTLMNPRTSEADLLHLVRTLREEGAKLLAEAA